MGLPRFPIPDMAAARGNHVTGSYVAYELGEGQRITGAGNAFLGHF